MKTLLALFVLLLAATNAPAQGVRNYGPLQDGYRLGKDDAQHFYLTNTAGIVLAPVDSLKMDTDSVIADIKRSNMKDRLLIARILEMRAEYDRVKELMYMTQAADELALIVMRHLDAELRKKYSSEKLNELKLRTN